MDDVFNIVVPDQDQVTNPGAIDTSKSRYLFDCYASMTLDDIKTSIAHFRTYGQDYHLQNLQWSEEFFKASSDPNLRRKILEKTSDLGPLEQGGPAYFFFMIQTILHVSEEGARVMLKKLQTMKLSSFQGEDVDKVVSLLRASLERLDAINKTPFDIEKQLFKVFRSCSVPEFSEFFKTMEFNHALGTSAFSVEEILSIAEDQYQKLSGEWNTHISKPSSFLSSSRQTICWNCGKKDHTIGNCPEPRDPNSPHNPFKQPPPEGQPHTKRMYGKDCKWCSKCKRWGNHFTDEHVVGYRSSKSQGNKASANTAEAASNPTANTVDAGSSAGVSFTSMIDTIKP